MMICTTAMIEIIKMSNFQSIKMSNFQIWGVMKFTLHEYFYFSFFDNLMRCFEDFAPALFYIFI